MNTTLVFAELLIIGLEGGIWLSLLLFSLFGLKDFDGFLSIIRDWQLVILAIVLPLLYVIGIILDRITDRLFQRQETKIEQETLGDFPVTVPVMRFSLGTENDFLNQQLEYTRTRMRVVRASSVNFVLIAISISIFLLTRLTNLSSNLRWTYTALILCIGLLFSYAAFSTWKSLTKGHLKLSKAMYEYQNQKDRKKKTLKKS